MIPAIEGTLNILSSCKKNPSLKRVILTSSSSTVRARDDFDPNVPLDESSWSSVELCERLQVNHIILIIQLKLFSNIAILLYGPASMYTAKQIIISH